MQFVCRVGTPEGRVLEEIRQARDEDALRGELERIGYHIFDIRRRGLLSVFGGLRRRSRKLPPRQLLVFNQELAALLRAGLPLLQGLNLVLERQRNPEFRATVAKLRDMVKGGKSLSEAVLGFGDLFPPLYAPTIMAGERSGNLEEVLDRFVRYQRIVLDARKRVISALVYPAVLICLSLVLISVMLFYVVPGFESFFSDLGTNLPWITKVIMALSSFLLDYWVWWLLGLVVATVLVVRMVGSAGTSSGLDGLKLRIPVIGGILYRFALSEFCRSLATLLQGGTPLVSALEVSTGAMSNAWLRQRLIGVPGKVAEGEAFHRALDETEALPDIAIDMVKVGEATGGLGVMLATVSDFLDEEVETLMQRFLTLIEPMLLVLMGVVIATLLIAVYLPLSTALSTVR
jgi:type IV pilus assembly protein PilC